MSKLQGKSSMSPWRAVLHPYSFAEQGRVGLPWQCCLCLGSLELYGRSCPSHEMSRHKVLSRRLWGPGCTQKAEVRVSQAGKSLLCNLNFKKCMAHLSNWESRCDSICILVVSGHLPGHSPGNKETCLSVMFLPCMTGGKGMRCFDTYLISMPKQILPRLRAFLPPIATETTFHMATISETRSRKATM